ncbi:MAG: tRNA (adenosine(37)-N6)-threonylcarbamoyltransferase complex transferase subunit TsaD [Spirochaetaceae bacterium]|jgi:N6-L-threonylcarbamoyladenine synthase|nr:tRNA (adenosine(37)-N6)-threonylcarbamoyltransferase complex transferase subunit TsaD [Spirochaetaceae bacterium]
MKKPFIDKEYGCRVLGIESSCDECAVAVVEDGEHILSNVILTQIPFHEQYAGVVPEIASRKHIEWILGVVRRSLLEAEITPASVCAVAATARPGLTGSLLVGHTFAKAFAWARKIPFVSCDHILAHLYASRLSGIEPAQPTPYPFLGLLVSGGHTIICRVNDFDNVSILGSTIDDAAGEAFDKVARHYGLGYPGGKYIDELAKHGDPEAFRFPQPRLKSNEQRYNVSYSGLKTAVINQLRLFTRKYSAEEASVPPGMLNDNFKADIAASFQKTAVDILLCAVFRAVEDTGISVIVTGGGVAANSFLRERLASCTGLQCVCPPAELCGDNGAMIAGLAYRYLECGKSSPLSSTVRSRSDVFRL